MVKGTRKTNALALPAGKTNTTLPHDRIKAGRQFDFNEFDQLRHDASFAQPRRIDLSVRQAECDIARNGIVDEKNILWHITDGSLPRGYQRRCKRLVVDQNLACGWLVQAEQQINESRFSRAGRPNYTERSVLRDDQRNFVQRWPRCTRIAKTDLAQSNRIVPTKRPRSSEVVATNRRRDRPVSFRLNKFVIHFVHGVAHRADLSQLAIKQLNRRQQPVTCKRHHAEVRKNIGKIAPSRCEQQHGHNETSKSERFHKITCAVENGHAGTHLRDDCGMAGKPSEKMFFGTMDFHRFNAAEHLMGFLVEARGMYS